MYREKKRLKETDKQDDLGEHETIILSRISKEVRGRGLDDDGHQWRASAKMVMNLPVP
jgi:hypothetical protein